MDLVKASIEKPVSVLVGVILVVLFGMVALTSLPYQLTPNVTEPEITVETNWSGATPYEIERDIVEEQEKTLKGVPGLIEMESQCYNGRGEITLKFSIETDVDEALLRVSNKLNEVPSYPDNADRPVISATGAATSPIIWMMLKALPENKESPQHYRTFFEDEVRQHIERVRGVADLFIGGGIEKEMQIIVNPERLAAYNLTIPKLISVLKLENVNVSAGNMGVGRRDYRIRVPAEFHSVEEIENIVISSTGDYRVTLGDVGKASFGYEKKVTAMLHNGESGIAVGVKPEPGANVLELTDQVHEVVTELNEGLLRENGIFLDWAYDQRPYINGAIALVKQNIIIGGLLAVTVLFIFLQSISSTIIVALAIPISIIGSFIIFGMMGRTLNVVSMAGISFAVGMLVDNAIVVLENIDRHRNMGKGPFRAAYDGASEVWGAVMASTLTTVAVFLPVAFIQEEAGQLFKDIAIAVTCAIVLSLFVSLSVIPMLARQFYSWAGRRGEGGGAVSAMGEKALNGIREFKPVSKIMEPGGIRENGKGALKAVTRFGGRAQEFIMGLLEWSLSSKRNRLLTVGGLTMASVLMVLAFFPKMEYLPQGNRNLVINILIPPPGLSYAERRANGQYIYDRVQPLMGKDEVEGTPGIESIFYVAAPTINLFGAISTQEQEAGRLIPYFNGIMNSIPGMFGVSMQAGIFQQGLGKGRTIDVDVSGPHLEQLIAAAGTMFGMVRKEMPGSQIRPIPSLELLYPEVRLLPDRDRVRAAGLSSEDLGFAVDVIMDGRKVGDFKEEGKKKIDLVLKSSDKSVETPEELYDALVATPQGWAVPVSSLAEIQRTYGVSQIRHLERQRTITLQVTPPPDVPLEQAMENVDTKIVPAVKKMGLLKDVDVRMSGAADKLSVTRDALQSNFILAVVITYLLMSALFGNFLYPLVILFTVPLAGAGGFLGLKLENWFIADQPLDVLTMLGFVILIGVVVNNAILIVHQSLNNIRDHGMEHRKAILEATRTRLRPIYMSAATSILGMLPLAVAPGPGSELYRGLGSVVLGGLALSTVFTIFVIPSLLMFFIGMEKGKREKVDHAT